MAEIFGIVAGALNVAALFNNCLDCFEYIQLGRHFGRDYQTCQLRLDIAKARLGRWGQVINIDKDARFTTESQTDKSVQLVHAILEEVMLLFLAAYKTSKRYETDTDQQDQVMRESDINPVFRGLHNRLQTLTRKRQRNASLIKKTAWALYDGKALEGMVNQITRLVDDLERVFPTDPARRKLAEVEIENVEDEPSLTVLEDAANGIDANKGLNSIREVKAGDRAKIQVGQQISEAVFVRGVVIADRTTNTVDTVVAKGVSTIQIGNRLGGHDFLND